MKRKIFRSLLSGLIIVFNLVYDNLFRPFTGHLCRIFLEDEFSDFLSHGCIILRDVAIRRHGLSPFLCFIQCVISQLSGPDADSVMYGQDKYFAVAGFSRLVGGNDDRYGFVRQIVRHNDRDHSFRNEPL